MTIMTTIMMMMMMTIQRGPGFYNAWHISCHAESSLKKKAKKKKIDRNQIKPAGTKKGGILLKNVQAGKGFVVQLKINTCNRTDSCK